MKLAFKIFCVVLFSPIIIPAFAVCGAVILLYKGVETAVEAIFEGISYLLDWGKK